MAPNPESRTAALDSEIKALETNLVGSWLANDKLDYY